MRRTTLPLLGVSLLLTAAGQQAPLPLDTLGFSHTSSLTEQQWEKRFRAIPDAKRVHANMPHLAAHPHNVGSDYQRERGVAGGALQGMGLGCTHRTLRRSVSDSETQSP